MEAPTKNSFFEDSQGRLRNPVYGFSILVIVLCHWSILEIGYFGVDIFILLSGYYLSNRYYKEKPRLFPFYLKRFFRLYPTYWIILLPFLFQYLLKIEKIDYSYIFLNILGFSNRFMCAQNNLVPGSWFIALIVSLYLLYPLVIMLFRIFQNKFITLAILSSSILLLQYLFISERMLIMTLRIPLFFIGIYLSVSNQDLSKFASLLRNDKIVLPLLALAYLILFQMSSMLISYATRWHTGLLWWSSVLFAPICVIPLFKAMAIVDPKYLYPLKIMGFCSFEIYLLHDPIMHIISSFIEEKMNIPHAWSFSIVLSLFFVIFFSFILRKVLDRIFSISFFSTASTGAFIKTARY